MVELVDAYVAVWLGLACAPSLREADPKRFDPIMSRYSSTVERLGYDELSRRYSSLVAHS
jgi:hypothetical protein